MRVIRSARKTTTVEISSDGEITVRCPLNTTDKAIEAVLEQSKPWIERKLSAIKKRVKRPINLHPGGGAPLLGTWLTICDAPYSSGAEMDEKALTFNTLLDDNTRMKCLYRLYKDAAQKYLTERTAQYAEHLGLKVTAVKISDAKGRWGSCSSKGNINYSWRLITAPPDAVDYVIVHELCHLVHMNHSQDFWALVERILPDYRQRKKRLKDFSDKIDWDSFAF